MESRQPMVFNATKTKAVIFQLKRHCFVHNITLPLRGSNIRIVDNINTLGVYFNKSMTWDTFVDSVTSSWRRNTRKILFFPILIKRIFMTLFSCPT